ncbi:putative something about silencing protein 10 isoform X2 [Apostichopus japonicus]|uniref:Putative something about silencing protein 10 isoform X2 n=1 Tax=Stichopus japonicus TaxID=307972 RepID=A0A2G8KAU4_STIJA|nr:putative something about silencing protein 10 isoform X2 [Apostichopus japonicus]
MVQALSTKHEHGMGTFTHNHLEVYTNWGGGRGWGRRAGRRQWQKNESDYDSDDPRSYRNVKDPDPSSKEYFYDEVDEFHNDRDKILINQDQTIQHKADRSDNEEEVLGWDEEDSEEELEKKTKEFQKHHHIDEMGSDLEEDGEDEDDTTDDKAWARKDDSFMEPILLAIIFLEDEEEEQAAEEEEARMIQRRMAEALDEGDFSIDIAQADETEKEETELKDEEAKVKKDLSKLTKKEKLQILKKESPEMMELVEDCKAKLLELKDELQPLMDQVKSGKIPPGTLGVTYLQTKYHLYLNYCLNINFYMVMKAKHISVKNHPVIGRILSYRKLINELKPADEQMKEEIEHLLSEKDVDLGEEMSPSSSSAEEARPAERKEVKKKRKNKKKLSAMLDEDEINVTKTNGEEEEDDLTEQEQKALEYYKKLEAQQQERKSMLRELHPEEAGDDDGEEMVGLEEGDGDLNEKQTEEEGKRAITYQISKNKGLTTRKKKELRNPRVKHRNKFRKAKIRRKGQVQEARTEVKRYGGELSGIRAGVVKSVKLK